MIFSIPAILFLILYSINTLHKSLYWTYIWQLKEYRTDRMLDYFSTKTGKKTVWNIWTFSELAFFLFFFIVLITWPRSDAPGLIFSVTILFSVHLLLQSASFIKNRTHPQWTFKALVIAVLTLLVLNAVPFFVPLLFNTITFLPFGGLLFFFPLMLFLSPIITSLFVFAFRPVIAVQKERIIRKAHEKIETLNPIVIGITGSYGKSSTKEFLKTILEQKFSVFATPKNVNVDIGVANTILTGLQPSHEVAIIEMGAYRQGEIDAICDLVSPIIGVITAISDQHYSLFGSFEAIKQTKAELIASLPQSGVAVLNSDSAACLEVAEKTRAEKKFFSVEAVAHVYASDIVTTMNEVKFMLHIGSKKAEIVTGLYGKQVVPSILAAATVADHLGLSIEEIARGIQQLKPNNATMQLRHGKHGMSIIDDHYSANPDGFMAALDYLAVFGSERRKIVITRGMDELGEQADTHHRLVGARIAEVADMLIITKKDFAKPLQDGAKKGGMPQEAIIVSEKPRLIIKDILSHCTPNDVILIENRIQPPLIRYILN